MQLFSFQAWQCPQLLTIFALAKVQKTLVYYGKFKHACGDRAEQKLQLITLNHRTCTNVKVERLWTIDLHSHTSKNNCHRIHETRLGCASAWLPFLPHVLSGIFFHPCHVWVLNRNWCFLIFNRVDWGNSDHVYCTWRLLSSIPKSRCRRHVT